MQGCKDICFIKEHPSNALSLIVFIELNKDVSDKEKEFLNEIKLMNATEEGIEIDFNDSRSLKQPNPNVGGVESPWLVVLLGNNKHLFL